MALVPSLSSFCLVILANVPDDVHQLGVRLCYRSDVLNPSIHHSHIDPCLWATLVQVYDNLPLHFHTHHLPLLDPRLLLLQRIPFTPRFSLLTLLDLPACPYLTDDTITVLRSLHSLVALDVSATTISSYAIKVLAATLLWVDDGPVRRGPWPLRIVRLRHCSNIDDTVYPHLYKFPLLSAIDLRGTNCKPPTNATFRSVKPSALYYPSPLSTAVDHLSTITPHLYSSPNTCNLIIDTLNYLPSGTPKRSTITPWSSFVATPSHSTSRNLHQWFTGNSKAPFERWNNNLHYTSNKDMRDTRNPRYANDCGSKTREYDDDKGGIYDQECSAQDDERLILLKNASLQGKSINADKVNLTSPLGFELPHSPGLSGSRTGGQPTTLSIQSPPRPAVPSHQTSLSSPTQPTDSEAISHPHEPSLPSLQRASEIECTPQSFYNTLVQPKHDLEKKYSADIYYKSLGDNKPVHRHDAVLTLYRTPPAWSVLEAYSNELLARAHARACAAANASRQGALAAVDRIRMRGQIDQARMNANTRQLSVEMPLLSVRNPFRKQPCDVVKLEGNQDGSEQDNSSGAKPSKKRISEVKVPLLPKPSLQLFMPTNMSEVQSSSTVHGLHGVRRMQSDTNVVNMSLKKSRTTSEKTKPKFTGVKDSRTATSQKIFDWNAWGKHGKNKGADASLNADMTTSQG